MSHSEFPRSIWSLLLCIIMTLVVSVPWERERERMCSFISVSQPTDIALPMVTGSPGHPCWLRTWKNYANCGKYSIIEDISDERKNVKWQINHRFQLLPYFEVENEKGVVSSGLRRHWLSLEKKIKETCMRYLLPSNKWLQAVAALNNKYILCGDQETDRRLGGCFWLRVCHEISVGQHCSHPKVWLGLGWEILLPYHVVSLTDLLTT